MRDLLLTTLLATVTATAALGQPRLLKNINDTDGSLPGPRFLRLRPLWARRMQSRFRAPGRYLGRHLRTDTRSLDCDRREARRSINILVLIAWVSFASVGFPNIGAAMPSAILDFMPDGVSSIEEIAVADDFAIVWTVAGFFDPALWHTDGTEDGTFRIALPRPLHGPVEDVSCLTPVGDKILGVVIDEFYQTVMWSIRKGDRQARFVAEFPQHAAPCRLSALPTGRALFLNSDSLALWATDGSQTGTLQLLDGVALGNPVVVGDRGIVAIGDPDTHLSAIWSTDGTHSGTFRLERPGGALPSSVWSIEARFADKILIESHDLDAGVGETPEYWLTDGIDVTPFASLPPGLSLRRSIATSKHLFAVKHLNDEFQELWSIASDGRVELLRPSGPHRVFFGAADPDHGSLMVFATALDYPPSIEDPMQL